MPKPARAHGIVLLVFLLACSSVPSQKPPAREAGSGDTPDTAGALAGDLSRDADPAAVARAMRKVGDWQLAKSRQDFSQDWTFAALYRGYLAAADSLHDPRYREAMIQVGNKFDWRPGSRVTHADDQAISYMYLKLYRRFHEARMMEPTKSELDRVLSMPDVCTESCPPWHDPTTPMWWWCDALFMAPPVWAELYAITRNKAYLDHMDREWWVTSKMLYDPGEHLFFRDTSYLSKHEANGKPIFWSRGNGWVMAGISEVLDAMPADYPSRPRYIAQFRQMAEKLKSIQGGDGLWSPGLLGDGAYPLPEVSGSAFFVYALAWGVAHGVLDRAVYLPVVNKGWAGLVSHVYADGRLGSIQPIGGGPDSYKPQTSYVFGVGAFLMAGSEIRELAEQRH